MSPELERKLVEKHPDLFANRLAPPSQSLMCFGFECGDGWFDLIDTLCERIVRCDAARRKESADTDPLRAIQVKEKYGTLRFYVGPTTDTILELIELAESLSAHICETCGNKGRVRGTGWLKTLCAVCAQKEGYLDEGRMR